MATQEGETPTAHQHCLVILPSTKELVSKPHEYMAQFRLITKL